MVFGCIEASLWAFWSEYCCTVVGIALAVEAEVLTTGLVFVVVA